MTITVTQPTTPADPAEAEAAPAGAHPGRYVVKVRLCGDCGALPGECGCAAFRRGEVAR